MIIANDFLLNIANTEALLGSFSGAVYLGVLLNYSCITIFIFIILTSSSTKNVPIFLVWFFQLWLLWSIFNFIRGAILAKNYDDWKFFLLMGIPSTFIALTFYLGNNLIYMKKVIEFTLKYVFIFSFMIIPLALVTSHELYPRFVIFVPFFILLIPYLKGKWKMLIMTTAVISLLIAVDYRANVIRIVLSILLLLIYYFRNFLGSYLLKITHIAIFLGPLIILSMGIWSNFSFFEVMSSNEDFVITDQNNQEGNALMDTRTFLYVEIFDTLNNTGNWLIGESSSQGYQSVLFYDTGGASNGVRYETEVGILNVLLNYGLIGVALFFMLLFAVSYYAIFKSGNSLSIMIGYYISFKWLLSFIEEWIRFDLNFFFFWLVMGLASSSNFRKMNNKQINKYLNT